MDRLKDHKETKVDETQVEAGQIRPGPGQEHVASSPSLLLPGLWLAGHLAPAEYRDGEAPARSHPLCHLLVCRGHVVPGPGPASARVRKNIPLIGSDVSLGRGDGSENASWNPHPSVRRARGRESWGRMGSHGGRKPLAFWL